MDKKLIYAGHSAFLLETNNLVIAIDPWLSSNPSCPEQLKSPEKIDLIVLSHGHSDHACEALELAIKHQCPIIGCFELINLLIADGLPENQAIHMNPGGCTNWKDIKICLTRAYHSSSYDTKSQGTQYAGIACGIIIKEESFCLYHAGDTSLFSDLKLIGETFNPDVACLPIGDIFTMGPHDAAVAASWVNCGEAIPMHYDTFPLLTGKASEFAAACTELGVLTTTLKPGESKEWA